MKYSKTALKELTARYRDVLKKCAFLNAVILLSAALAAPAGAEIVDTLANVPGSAVTWTGSELLGVEQTENISYQKNGDGSLTVTGKNWTSESSDQWSKGRGTFTNMPKAAKYNTETGETTVITSQDVLPTAGFTMVDSLFKDNTAAYSGGAATLWDNGNPGTTGLTNTFEDTTFEGNSAGLGGAIATMKMNAFAVKDNLNIVSSEFTGNKATATGDGPYVGGGALFLDGTALSTTGTTTFKNNESSTVGGAINVLSTSTADINGSTFTGNTADYDGGGIYNEGALTLTNSTFTENTADYYGGAIENVGSASITNTKFTDNTAAKWGGAIDHYGTTLTTEASTFKGNSAEQGGAIAVEIGGLNDTGSTFEGNHAYVHGAVFDTRESSGMTFTNSRFIGNTGEVGVGAVGIYSRNATSVFDNVEFTSNSAEWDGAMYIGSEAKVKLLNGTIFDSNSATYGAGALGTREFPSSNATGKLDIDHVTFKDNTTADVGGAIDNYFYNDENNDGYVKVTNSTFTGNEAATGGAVYNHKDATQTGSMYFADSDFTGNTATTAGAIFNEGDVTIKDSSFAQNSATGGAGAIANKDTAANLTLNNVTFTENTSDWGGAIIARGKVDITGGSFTGNSSSDGGGAIYLATLKDKGHKLSIDGTTFTGNHTAGVDLDGGGAIGSFSDLKLKNSTFNGNYVEGEGAHGGGALFLGSVSTNDVKDTTFTENSSATNGGAISMRYFSDGDNHDATLDVDGATFTGNTATGNGGAIYNTFYNDANNDGYVKVTDSTFAENAADKGGAVYNAKGLGTEVLVGGNPQTGNIYLADSDFTGNTATTAGGAIYNEGVATVAANTKNVEFSGNTAAGNANDIYNSGNLTLNAADGRTLTLNGGIDGNAGTLTVTSTGTGTGTVKMTGDLKNQTALVSSGELWLAKENDLTGSAVTVASGATINTIDDIITDYTTSIALGDGALIKGDIDFVEGTADQYAAAEDSTVNYKLGNLLSIGQGEKTIQVVSDGAKVNTSGAAFTSDLGAAFVSTGLFDGKIKITGMTGGIDQAATNSGKVSETEYTQTANETVTADTQFKNAASIDGNGHTLELDGVSFGAGDGATFELKNVELTGTGTLINAATAKTKITDSVIRVDGFNAGLWESDPTDYYGNMTNTAIFTVAGDTFKSTGSLENYNIANFKEDGLDMPTFEDGSKITGSGVVNLLSGQTVFGTSSAITNTNKVNVVSGADFKGTLSGGSLDLHNGALDTITGSFTGGDVILDAKLGSTKKIDTLSGGVSGATIKEINILGTEYGTDDSVELTLGAGATLDPNVQINGMNYYTDVSYDDVTGKLTLKDKLLNTSSIRGTGDGSTTFVGDIKIGDKADTVTLGTDTSKIALDHTAGTVGLTGDTTITGDLAVTGATTLTGALAVTGATTLTGALTANGGITTTDIASTSLTTNAAGKTVAIGGTGYTTTVTGNEVVTGTLSAGATTVDSLKLSGSTPVISSVQTTVRATGTADDVSLVTEKAVRTALTDTTDALLAANNTWTGVNTFNHSEDAAGAGVTGFSVTATDTDALAGGSSATTASLSVNSKTGVTVTGDETVTGNLAVTGATTLTGALTANGGITTTDIASTALTTSASGKTVAIGGTGYTTTVTGNEVVTGDLTVTGLTTFGATGFDLGGKTVTAIDDDGTNVSSSVAQATRQATLATAETVYAGAKTADYNGSTAGLNIAANETLGGAIGSLDTAIGNRDYADTSVYATTPSYLTAGESVAESLVALDKELTDTNTILGPAEVTAQTTGQFAGKKVGVDINVVDAVSELGVNMVSLGANNIFTGVNTFKNAAGIAIQDASGGNQVTLKAEADPSSTFSMLTVDRVINAPALRLGSNMVTSIDINGSGVTAANADKEVIATTKTVYSGAENALFTGPSSPSAALGSAATINAAITNVAGATDTNTTNIATLQSGKMDKADIVTAWSSTTSDTKVASEKLVKDTLDTKADLTGNNTFAGNNSFTGTQTMTNTVADASTATALSVAATNTAGSHSLVVSTDGVKVDGSDVLTQASIVTSAAGWSATTSDTKVASEKLVKDSLDAKVDNAGNFTAASNSDLIEGKTVIAAIQDTAAQVDINTAAIGTTSDGTYVLAANSVGQNLNALDAQVLANTTAIGTTSDGTYVAAANSVGQNLNALDTQVALNTAAIASVSGMIGTDPTAIATGSALNQLPGAYTQISGNGASGSITLADATSKLSEAFTNGQIDTNFKSVTTSSATVTNTETTAGNVATAFTAIAQNTADGKSTTLKVTSDNVELTQSGNTIHLGVENVGGGIGTALVVDANAGFSGIVKADGFDVGSTFSVNSSGAIEKAASITSDGKLTVNAGGADITGATSITGDTTITGDASVSGTATLGALTFNGTDTADAIATAGLDRGASGSATTLASTASVAATITTQAQDATYTNLVTSGSNITGGTIQLALKGLDEVIGNRSISSANSDVDSALGTSVSAAIAKIGDKLGDVDFSSANNTAATDLTTAISDVDAAVGDISALTTSKIISANTDLTTAVKSLEDNVATAMGGTFTNGAWSYTVDNTAGYAAYTAQTNVADAIDQVASNIGTAAEITTTGINGVANNQTVNKNIDELNKTLGNIKALDGTDGTGPKGNLAAANSTVADHLNAIDARMGDIAGLNTKRGASAKGNLDTTATAKVEDHFVALDDAIGDRTAFSNTVGVDYSTTGLNNNNVVGAISQVASNVGSTPVTGANGNVAAGNTVNQNLDALDAAIGDIGQFSQSEYMSRNATIADGMMNLDHNLHRVEKEMRGGFASMAALSALVPNARGAGDTQLSVGTGAYRDHQGIAVGAFHYFNDNVLANMGFSYGGDKSAIFRAGVTFGW